MTDSLELIAMGSAPIGSKDSAIAGTNSVLIDGLYNIYTRLLEHGVCYDSDVADIYASGMVTCPYGICEVPHLAIPITTSQFAEKIYPFWEKTRFCRTINLIPGIKTTNDDFAYINNVRGEEIEILGLMDDLESLTDGRETAVVMPGSHTHIMHVKGGEILGILSNFTGELFHAIRSATIMSPELDAKVESIDPEVVKYGVENLKKFGFNRALYIGHAMKMFEKNDDRYRLSYCEGVILGGVSQSLSEYCQTVWPDCKTAVIVASQDIINLYTAVLETCAEIKEIIPIPLLPSRSYALEGFKKLIKIKSGK